MVFKRFLARKHFYNQEFIKNIDVQNKMNSNPIFYKFANPDLSINFFTSSNEGTDDCAPIRVTARAAA